jgi:hypothetical protein
MSCSSGPHLPAEAGSSATTCPTAPNLASLSGWVLALPHVLYLRASPPGQGGLRCCRVSHGSRPRLTTGVGSGAATWPTTLCWPWASDINKGLAGLAMQLSSRVSKACSRVSKASDARAIMACNT